MTHRAATLWRLLRNERLDPEVLQQRQFRQLQALVAHAWTHVPAYRDSWRERGLEPAMLRSPQDFARWPVIDKATIRRNGVSRFLDERLGGTDQLVRCSTSGSSGTPFEFWFSREHDAWRKAQYLRPYLSTGRRLSDRVLRLGAAPPRATPWFERLGLLREVRVDGSAPAARIAARWRALRPEVVQGYGSTLRALALESRHGALPPPRRLYTDSELLTPDTRRLLHERFGVDPIDVFGTYESDNIAWQCERRDGYHVGIDCTVVEVLDAAGEPTASGEGELVVTILGNLAMPFVRYRLGDRARWIAGECGCGRSLPRLEVRSGRSEHLLRVGGEWRSPMSLLARFDTIGAAVVEYRIVQERQDTLRVLVVPGPAWTAALPERIRGWVAAELPGFQLEIERCDALQRVGAGKHRSFESRLPQNPA